MQNVLVQKKFRKRTQLKKPKTKFMHFDLPLFLGHAMLFEDKIISFRDPWETKCPGTEVDKHHGKNEGKNKLRICTNCLIKMKIYQGSIVYGEKIQNNLYLHVK